MIKITLKFEEKNRFSPKFSQMGIFLSKWANYSQKYFQFEIIWKKYVFSHQFLSVWWFDTGIDHASTHMECHQCHNVMLARHQKSFGCT